MTVEQFLTIEVLMKEKEILEVVINLNKNQCQANQTIHVSEEVYLHIDQNPIKYHGITVEIKPKRDLIKELFRLPAFIDFEGIQFRLEIFINRNEDARLVYNICDVDKGSKHYRQVKHFGCWDNPITGHTGSFLWLAEYINSEEELFKDIDRCYEFLRDNNLIISVTPTI